MVSAEPTARGSPSYRDARTDRIAHHPPLELEATIQVNHAEPLARERVREAADSRGRRHWSSAQAEASVFPDMRLALVPV